MSTAPQTYANHRAWPAPFPALVAGLLVASLAWSAWDLFAAPSVRAVVSLGTSIALVGLWFVARTNALRVQDRVIRLEMRLRLERVLGAARRADVERIGVPQLVALRFASDAELAALVDEVLAGRLVEPDAIKRRVRDWQADRLRV